MLSNIAWCYYKEGNCEKVGGNIQEGNDSISSKPKCKRCFFEGETAMLIWVKTREAVEIFKEFLRRYPNQEKVPSSASPDTGLGCFALGLYYGEAGRR